MKQWDGKNGGTVSPKLDGVYARATKDGVFSKSGNPLDLPHVSARLKRHFRKNPDAVLEGEVFRKGEGIEKIAGAVKTGGAATRKLKLHIFPKDGEKRPLPFGAVRRVSGKKVSDAAGVEKVFQKVVKRGQEGVVVRGADGVPAKLKPKQDAEWEVAKVNGGSRGVLVMKHGDRTFKVQSKPGLTAKAGDKVQVSYSGTTKKGVPKAAVAQRVRNENDFEVMKNNKSYQSPARLLLGDAFPHRQPSPCVRVFELARETVEEEIARDRAALKRIGIGAAAAGGVAAAVIHKGRLPKPAAVAPLQVVKTAPVVKKAAPSYWGKKKRLAKVRLQRLPTLNHQLSTLNLEEKRDTLSKVRDGAIIAGTGAVGAGALVGAHQARKLRKKADAALGYASSGVARAARQVRETVTPKAVAHEGLQLIKNKAKEKAIEYFPTFAKIGRALKKKVFSTPAQRMGVIDFAFGKAQSKAAALLRNKIDRDYDIAKRWNQHKDGSFQSHLSPMLKEADALEGAARRAKKRDTRIVVGGSLATVAGGAALVKKKKSEKKSFSTPAQRMGIEFAVSDQLVTKDKKTYASPLKVAAGTQEAYRRGSNTSVDLPIGDMQVVKAAYRKAGDISKWGTRGGRLVKDASDVITGKPRARDASGRKKKREWEKGWAGEAAKKAAITGGVLAYATGMKRSPRFRDANLKAVKAIKDKVNGYLPNTFATPARAILLEAGLLEVLDFAKKEKPRDNSAAKAGVGAAIGGGAHGALLGGLSAAGSKQADDYFSIMKQRESRASQGGLMVAKKPKSPVPFKAKGKFNNAEKIARAEHNALANLKKSVRRRSIIGGVAGAAILGGGAYAAEKAREGKKKRFSTPAQRMGLFTLNSQLSTLNSFDDVAAEAGWDVRDPRGKSARVFAPGSKRRVRREKTWSEEIGNERKLWKAGVVGAGLLAGAAGVAVGRRLKKPAERVIVPFPKRKKA